MADVIRFPTRPAKQKTLVIEDDDPSGSVVRLDPILAAQDRTVRMHFTDVGEARRGVCRARWNFPDLYTAIVDKTLPELGGAA